jgi:hypothetical protein
MISEAVEFGKGVLVPCDLDALMETIYISPPASPV